MKFQDLDLSRYYTYADYLSWKFEETVELIRGKVFRMSPAPHRYHQEVSSRLLTRMLYFFEDQNCKVFHAPFDVRLPLPPEKTAPEQIDTVVQPDISVICELSKLDYRGCLGPPDWIIEIISPGSVKRDTRYKFELYEYTGVKEYWILHPEWQSVHIYRLDGRGKFVGYRPYTSDEEVSPTLFPSLTIKLGDIFPDMPDVEEALMEYYKWE
ncbi:MAG: Uma2 family endonuclease [Saprospiraceae bacterium]|nr:Uma2 family endonuclease [Saprospiraceae bacterium]